MQKNPSDSQNRLEQLSCDVCVIGGGVIGLSIGWTLQRVGLNTVVVDAAEAGRGASWAAGGMLAPVSEAHFTEPDLLALSRDSMRRYADFVERLEHETGFSVDYDDSGTVAVALDADEARELQRLLDFQTALNLPASWLTSRELRHRLPTVSPRAVGAVHAPQDHQVDNRKLVTALAEAFRRSGGRICNQWPVFRIEHVGGELRRLHGPRGAITTSRAVLAAGAWCRQIRGVPEAELPPVRPVRGQMLCLQMDPEQPLTQYVIRGRRAYLIPRRDGRLLVGATSEERGFDPNLTAGGVFELLRGARELLPGTDELDLIDMWTGFRPACVDNLPVLGPSRTVDGLHYATGHFRAGILLAPVSAWAVSSAIINEKVPAEIAAFSPARFADN